MFPRRQIRKPNKHPCPLVQESCWVRETEGLGAGSRGLHLPVEGHSARGQTWLTRRCLLPSQSWVQRMSTFLPQVEI